MTETDPKPVEESAAEVEHQFHHYTGNRIPWYVHLIWVSFWIFVVYYALTYLFPTLQIEFPLPS